DRLRRAEPDRADPPVVSEVGAERRRRAVAPANEARCGRRAGGDRPEEVPAGIQEQEVDEVLEARHRIAMAGEALERVAAEPARSQLGERSSRRRDGEVLLDDAQRE